MDEFTKAIRTANKAEAWERLASSATCVSRLLEEPQPGLVCWIEGFDRSQREASAAAKEIGLPFRGMGHAVSSEEDQEEVTTERLRERFGFDNRFTGPDQLVSVRKDPATGGVVTWALIYNLELSENWHKERWYIAFPGCTTGLGYDLPTMGDVRRLLVVLKIPTGEM